MYKWKAPLESTTCPGTELPRNDTYTAFTDHDCSF